MRDTVLCKRLRSTVVLVAGTAPPNFVSPLDLCCRFPVLVLQSPGAAGIRKLQPSAAHPSPVGPHAVFSGFGQAVALSVDLRIHQTAGSPSPSATAPTGLSGLLTGLDIRKKYIPVLGLSSCIFEHARSPPAHTKLCRGARNTLGLNRACRIPLAIHVPAMRLDGTDCLKQPMPSPQLTSGRPVLGRGLL